MLANISFRRRQLSLRLDQSIDFFVDESSQTAHRYTVHGLLWVPSAQVAPMLHLLKLCRQRHGYTQEIGWTKVNRYKYGVYEDWLAVLGRFVRRHKVKFSALVFDTSQFDHKRYNEGDAELGFNKILFYFLLHRAGRLSLGTAPLFGYLDERTTKHTPDRLREMLNAAMADRWQIYTRPFRRLVFRRSTETELIQLVDLLIGGIAYQWNEHGRAKGSRPEKRKLSELILRLREPQRLGMLGGFSIWEFKFIDYAEDRSREPRPRSTRPLRRLARSAPSQQ